MADVNADADATSGMGTTTGTGIQAGRSSVRNLRRRQSDWIIFHSTGPSICTNFCAVVVAVAMMAVVTAHDTTNGKPMTRWSFQNIDKNQPGAFQIDNSVTLHTAMESPLSNSWKSLRGGASGKSNSGTVVKDDSSSTLGNGKRKASLGQKKTKTTNGQKATKRKVAPTTKPVPSNDDGVTVKKLANPTQRKPKKHTKKKMRDFNTTVPSSPRQAINQGLAEKDAADVLGDAIRERASQLLSDNHRNHKQQPPKALLHPSLQSVGYAIGASDAIDIKPTRLYRNPNDVKEEREGDYDVDDWNPTNLPSYGNAGIEVAPSSVVAQYFLKSHGGAHALQCLCSILAATAGLGVILLPTLQSQHHQLQLTLLKRCMLFAMMKHISGLIAASYIAATQGIPEVGFWQTVEWMQELVTNPVSQYVFYAAIVLVWLSLQSVGSMPGATVTTAAATVASTSTALGWWQTYRIAPILLAGPVILRESISTALVISDVLVLTVTSGQSSDGRSSSVQMIQRLLSLAQGMVNAFMSLLVSSSVWHSSTALQRQALVAKGTSKLSLVLEVGVGLLFIIDSIIRGIGVLFLNNSTTNLTRGGGMLSLIKSLICTRLYLQFLWKRRRKLLRLASTLRGGAAIAPMYVLTALLDLPVALGLSSSSSIRHDVCTSSAAKLTLTDKDTTVNKTLSTWTWKDYLREIMGWD